MGLSFCRNCCLGIFLLVASCNSNQTNDKEKSASQTTISEPTQSEQRAYGLAPEIEPFIKITDSIFDRTPLFFNDGDRYYFYVLKGSKEGWLWDKGSFTNPIVMGIVTDKLDTILPLEYDKLYTPDATAKNYIEIERDGKRGMVNYRTKQLIPARYDIIFPSHKQGIIGVGKVGNKHYMLSETGSEEEIHDPSLVPRYANMRKELEVDILKNNWRLLVDTYVEYYFNENQNGHEQARGLFVAPSYIWQTGFVSEYILNLNMGDDAIFHLEKYNNSIEYSKTNDWGISTLISSFYEEGTDGRGYSVNKKHLVTTDSNNNIISKQELLVEYDDEYNPYCETNIASYKIIGDSIIEIAKYAWFNDSSAYYNGMPVFNYFAIKNNGNVVPLESNRAFAFTQFVLIDESHLKGCYLRNREFYPKYKWPKNEDTNVVVTSYLSLEMLDLMRNEIFATYGYRFKQDKWKEYFSEKPWYKAQHENVDQLLTPMDKANLETIKIASEKLSKNPKPYLNERLETFFYGP
ncbi:hypothetical protein BH09BAC1_BH09BAC1_16580 [soil metagenome]